jgi:hypothetical protein
MIYRPEERWLARIKELEGMAKKAGHTELIKTMLGIPDAGGTRIISVACENNCPKIVVELLKRGMFGIIMRMIQVQHRVIMLTIQSLAVMHGGH